ncbi:PEPxxWA-CTERM sorting domain-containing protein [uncultured Phenylobacterium sp.]|uniref:PEPxxWA-CTERM sorting domain-containing protein n=1 Tax=uncultured Phenylobacterium sp. TaxID=349273 RepID=UPI0025EB1D98|nr:PEPxxWA-CTERM sorting domain-containing protein [uncultured Phenylobacterium sp.]
MLKLALAAAVAGLTVGAAAQAAVIPSLSGVTANADDFTFTYQGTLSGDAGLTAGSKLVIFDFAGYVDGSVFADLPTVTATSELVSLGLTSIPGQIDDPTIANLVFTYNGPDFQTSGGPFEPVDFNGIGARSIFSGLGADTFAAVTVKNNPDNTPGGTGTPIFDQGFVTVPLATAVPEPATWAMMVLGFGGAGALIRSRRRVVATA